MRLFAVVAFAVCVACGNGASGEPDAGGQPSVGWLGEEVIDGSPFGVAAVASDGTGNVVATLKGPGGLWAKRFDAATGWQPPEFVAERVARNQDALAANDSGDAVLVWHQEQGDLKARRYIAGPGWQPPVSLAALGQPDAYALSVSMADSGSILVVWGQGSPLRFMACRYEPSDGWSSARVIDSGDTLVTVGRPQIVRLASGDEIVAWYGDGEIWTNRHDVVQGWGVAETIETTDPSDPHSLRLAADGQGNAMLVMDMGDGLLWKRYTPAFGWSPGQVLSFSVASLEQVRLASDPAGNMLATWVASFGEEIWWIRFDATSGWGERQLVRRDPNVSPMIEGFEASENGTMFLMWRDGVTSAHLWASRYAPSTGWEPQEMLDAGDAFIRGTGLTVDPKGNAMVVWGTEWGFETGLPRANRYVAP